MDNITKWMKPGLVICLTLTFCMVIGYVVMHGVKKMEAQEAMVFGTIIGYLANNFSTVVNFFFGSSSSSQSKDEVIANMTKS